MTDVVEQRVKIILEGSQETQKRLNKVSAAWSKFANNAKFGDVMKMNLKQMGSFNNSNLKLKNSSANVAWALRMFTHGLRGFRMEMIGITFFGVGLTRFVEGLLQPATDAAGVFDMWNDTLELFFLPSLVKLLPALTDLNTALEKSPKELKTAVGDLIIVLEALGVVLAVGGTLALGIGSLTTAFSDSKTSADLLKSSLKSLKTVMKGISLTIGLVVAWKWLKDAEAMAKDVKTTLADRFKLIFEGALAGAFIG